jgi:hypothetical protein
VDPSSAFLNMSILAVPFSMAKPSGESRASLKLLTGNIVVFTAKCDVKAAPKDENRT